MTIAIIPGSQTEGPLTQLFNATTTPAKATVNLNSLFGEAAISDVTHKINKSSTSSSFTLHIKDTVTVNVNLNNTTLTSPADLATILPTMSTSATENSPQSISLIHSLLTQRQRCTRSTDNASPSVAVVKASTSSVQTNILILVIIGLCIAAFFQPIYSGLICFPSGNKNHGAIHMLYLIGALSIAMPLFVRGFKDGDVDSQVWGVGIVVIMLIFGWKYAELSGNDMLKCSGSPVININFLGQIGQLGENKRVVGLLLFVLFPFWVSAFTQTSDSNVFSWLLGTQAVITGIAIFAFNKYGV